MLMNDPARTAVLGEENFLNTNLEQQNNSLWDAHTLYRTVQ